MAVPIKPIPKNITNNDGLLPLARVKEIAENREERVARRKARVARALFNPKVRAKAIESRKQHHLFKVKKMHEKHLRAIQLLADFMNDWSPEYICGQCNINLATLYKWRNDPTFMKMLDNEITKRQAVLRLEAHKRLFKAVKKGNPRLLLAYLKMTGDLTEKVDLEVKSSDIDKMKDEEVDAQIAELTRELKSPRK